MTISIFIFVIISEIVITGIAYYHIVQIHKILDIIDLHNEVLEAMLETSINGGLKNERSS